MKKKVLVIMVLLAIVGTTNITFAAEKKCKTCKGAGWVLLKCTFCDGKGTRPNPSKANPKGKTDCGACMTGKYKGKIQEMCVPCRGEGIER